jgi:uroporphyrinogen-III synthase
MIDRSLGGLGVLVTRPAHQATELMDAIAEAGGEPILFPAIEIVPRDKHVIEADAAILSEPDIAIFVSANAVRYGLEYAAEASVAVIGPATAAAVEAAGRVVDIRPAGGFDSEHLLIEPELESVDGNVVRIIRGTRGRELLGDSLRRRGAAVEYLAVYERRAPEIDAAATADIERRMMSGDVDAVTVMSVETLTNLVSILPEPCRERLGNALLVTPAQRVIIEAQDLFPGISTALADSTDAGDIVRAIAEHAPGHP